MKCALSREDELSFLALVYKELEVKADAKETINLEDHIKDFYNKTLAESGDEAKALSYTQILPEFMLAAYANKKRRLKGLKLDLNQLDEIADLFDDENNVQAFVSTVLDTEVIQDTIDSIKEEASKPKPTQESFKEAAARVIEFMFKPQTPISTTGQQGVKTEQLSDVQIASIIRKSMSDVPTAAQITDYRINGPEWSNLKNKSLDFYYDFFHVFADALSDANYDTDQMTINGHTGFKIKLVNKTQIPIEKAKQDEQNFAKSVGLDAYNKAAAAVITDTKGNILYFDKDYNVVSEEIGMPIYHNIRKIKQNDKGELSGYGIQSAEEIAKNRFVPTKQFQTIDQVKATDPTLYNSYVEKAKADLQIQLQEVNDLRTYLLADSTNYILANITGVSRGVVDINQSGESKWSDIDWEGSDIKPTDNVIVATRSNPALGEVSGRAYLRIPGNRSIELQRDNISQTDVNKLADLLFDDLKEIKNNREVPVSFETKKNLFEGFVITNNNSIQFISNSNKILLKGKDITTIPDAKEQVKAFLSEPSTPGSKYNKLHGQYRFGGTEAQGNFTDFTIEDGILKENVITLESHIKDHSTLKVIPNETGQIVFLNGYFTFSLPIAEEEKITEQKESETIPEIKETEDISIEDKIAELRKMSNEIDDIDPDTLYRSRVLEMKSTPEEVKKAKQWFENSPISKHVGYTEMFNVVNSNGWADFKNGAITLYAGADHTALYHEAWHAFSQHYLSKEEKKSLYGEVLATPQGSKAINEFAKSIGKDSYHLTDREKALAVEELIAEDFRKYVLSGGKKVLDGKSQRNTIFRKILNFLKEILGLVSGTMWVNNNTYQLTELFNKLYIGQINHYKPSVSNAFFTETLNKSYDKTVSDQDSKLLIDSIDSIMSMYIDEKNAKNGNTKFTNAAYSNPEVIKHLYSYAKNELNKRALQMYSEAQELEGTARINKLQKANLIFDAVKEFGDHTGGLMKFHMNNSELFSSEIKNLDKDAFNKTDDETINERFDKASNSLSLVEHSSNQILSLVRGLKKYENGKVVLNELGFPELTHWKTVWKTLASTLSDNNDSPSEMKEAMEKIAPMTPWVNDLLAKLGPTNSEFSSVQDLWTGFWAAFYMSHEKLYQVLINEEFTEDEDGNTSGSTFEVLAGYASAVFRKVELDFRSNFKISNHSNPYIKDIPKLGNILDLQKVIDNFSNKSLSTNKEKFDFITAIGLPITQNNEILNGLSDVNVGFIFDKLVVLNKHGFQITDIIKTLKENIYLEDKKEALKVKSEASNVNKILNLEAKYSGKYSNSSVTTSEGNIAYEQTQMATFSKMIKAMNKAQSLDELIAIPYMSYLDPRNNTSVGASNILKSLFDATGKKRKGVTISINNLDGTQNIINNSYSDIAYSSSTSKTDKYTRLLQDVYSVLIGGKAALFTPSDKGTILSFGVNDINTPRSEDKHLYVDAGDFGKKGVEANLGIEKTFYLMLPYLDGELKRIEKIKTDSSLIAIDGYTVPVLNQDGTIKKEATGLSLGIFDDIFPSDLKTEILKYKSISEIPAELQGEMLNKFNAYMGWQMQQNLEVLDRTMFIDSNLKSLIESKVGRKLNNEELKKVIIGAYTANKFINNAEALILFFGDIAQYKDFDKRNSAIYSNGRMFRTDKDFYDFVNNEVKRKFTQKYLGETTPSSFTKFNGILQTAVLKDNLVDSESYKEYLEFATKKLGETKAKQLLAPYLNMEEGDAQGWITMDTYRILGKASNRWSEQQESLYLQILNNPETVDPSKVLEYFPVRKYQYFGPLAVEGIHATAFHKYSLMPLIPEVIKGKNLEVLHNKMMEQGVDYAVYRTGSKIGNIVKPGTSGGDVFYKEGRSVNENITFTKNPIYLEYLKDQLDINSHFKNKVIFSTQLRKLVEEGLAENGVPVDFKPEITDKNDRVKEWRKAFSKGETTPFYQKYKTYENRIKKLVEFRMAELTAEVAGEDRNTDVTKLVKFITKELDRQDLADHEKEFIGVNSKGELIHDLSISPSAVKIEKTLNSIANRRLIKQKINGEALVQVSNSMFEATNPTEEDLTNWGTGDLKTYTLKDGKTQSMEVKVALQGKFNNLLHLQYDANSKVAVYTKRAYKTATGQTKFIKELDQENSLRRLNELINTPEFLSNPDNVDMITMVGVRIPVQGLNSMEFMRIKEFLPTSAGNIIVPPAEIVAKSGADFDIDKLTIMMPSLTIIGGRPEILRESDKDLIPTAIIKRISELKEMLKEARVEKSKAKKLADSKFEALQKTKNLSLELLLEKAELLDPFIEASKQKDADIEKYQNRITKYAGKTDLTPEQEAAVDEAWAAIENLHNIQDQIEDDLMQARIQFGISKKIFNSEAISKSEEGKAYAKALQNIDNLKRELGSLSGEAIENSIILDIKSILEMEHNFLNLITPNSTHLVLPAARDRAGNRDYNDKMGAWGVTSGISPTRNLEVGYNIYKHDSNSVGKETLGLGAVDNTFNTIFNRIGAYMNTEYTTSNHKRRATILLKHNTLNESNISLSHLYDADNENKISDIINQLLNGWLDVAKDAWIFDIQGNKQITPVLMFMLQAGVPFELAVDFVSNPLIKKYVNEQNIITSSFAKALGEAPKNANAFKNKAQKNVFGAIGILPDVSFMNIKNGKIITSGASIYKETIKRTKDFDFTDKAKSIANLDETSALRDNNAIAAFLHYLELEKLAEGIRDIKMTLNYDTSTNTTLFDAQKTKVDLEKLKQNDLFPEVLIENFFNETPVGSFNISDFQLKLWAPLFKIRNNKQINDELLSMISDYTVSKKMKEMFGSEEAYVEEFKNALIVKLFIDGVKNEDLSKGYKGLNVEIDTVKEVPHLDRGVAITKDSSGKPVVYIDRTILEEQFLNKLFTGDVISDTTIGKTRNKRFNYNTLGLAPVNILAFASETGEQDYINFSIEREYLRLTNPFSEFSKTLYFEKTFKRNLGTRTIIEGESKSDREQRLLKVTYEELLRDMALDNTLNFWKLFKSYNNTAEQLFEIKDMHPSLVKDFMIVNDFILSEGGTKNTKGKRNIAQAFKNLSLRDNRVDASTFEIYYENMLKLSNDNVIPIKTIEDKLENQRLNEFFSRLPLVAMLQSGLDTKNNISMLRAMPTNKITQIIESQDFSKIFDSTNSFNNFVSKFNENNSKKNIATRKRLQDYAMKKGVDATRSLTKHNFKVDHTLALNKEFNSVLSGETTSRTYKEPLYIKEGDVIEFNDSSTKRSIIVRATSNEFAVDDFLQFNFEIIDTEELINDNNFLEIDPANIEQLEALIKNNPDVIFVLEGSEASNELYVPDLGKIKPKPNVIPLITRIRPSDELKDIWNSTTVEANKQFVQKSLDRIQEFYDDGKQIAFLSADKGYGTYMLNNNSQGKVIDSNTYNYLSTELLKRFNYANKYSKIMKDTQALIKDNQAFKEFSIDIPFNEIIEAQDRLTCKTS